MGRFTQEDVYRGDGLNLYAYCNGNPVVYYDPSGYSLGPTTKRSVIATGDTEMAIKDALIGVNTGDRGAGFVILKSNLKKDKSAIKVLEQNNLKGIWYRDGRPDFTPVSMFNVKIPNMSSNRDKKGGNYDQTRKAIAEEIVKHEGNFNKLMESGIISEYATGNTKKETFKFLQQYANPVLKSDLSEDKKIEKLAKLVEKKIEYNPATAAKRYTVHEVDTVNTQLVPTEINARYNHDGGVSDCKKKDDSITERCKHK